MRSLTPPFELHEVVGRRLRPEDVLPPFFGPGIMQLWSVPLGFVPARSGTPTREQVAARPVRCA